MASSTLTHLSSPSTNSALVQYTQAILPTIPGPLKCNQVHCTWCMTLFGSSCTSFQLSDSWSPAFFSFPCAQLIQPSYPNFFSFKEEIHCGWPPDMTCSCKYIEQAIIASQQGVVLQLRGWLRV